MADITDSINTNPAKADSFRINRLDKFHSSYSQKISSGNKTFLVPMRLEAGAEMLCI
jgi:hypothetical protein